MVPFGDVVGTWMVVGDLTFPTVVTFTAANGQFTNGTFTWEVTNTLTGQVTTVQGTYTFGPVPEGGLGGLTLVSQGEIVFRGIYAQPGPGEFIIETFADVASRGCSRFLPVLPAVAVVVPAIRSPTGKRPGPWGLPGWPGNPIAPTTAWPGARSGISARRRSGLRSLRL